MKKTHEELLAAARERNVQARADVDALVADAVAIVGTSFDNPLALVVHEAKRAIDSAREIVALHAEQVQYDPAYHMEWGDDVIASGYTMRWHCGMLKAIVRGKDNDERLSFCEERIEALREDIMDGRLEQRSTSTLKRASGEIQNDKARSILRWMGSAVRQARADHTTLVEEERRTPACRVDRVAMIQSLIDDGYTAEQIGDLGYARSYAEWNEAGPVAVTRRPEECIMSDDGEHHDERGVCVCCSLAIAKEAK